jgi:hypothetical protein
MFPGGDPAIGTALWIMTTWKMHRDGRGRTMRDDSSTAGFATKAIYFSIAAVILVFVSMLVLTVLHP